MSTLVLYTMSHQSDTCLPWGESRWGYCTKQFSKSSKIASNNFSKHLLINSNNANSWLIHIHFIQILFYKLKLMTLKTIFFTFNSPASWSRLPLRPKPILNKTIPAGLFTRTKLQGMLYFYVTQIWILFYLTTKTIVWPTKFHAENGKKKVIELLESPCKYECSWNTSKLLQNLVKLLS